MKHIEATAGETVDRYIRRLLAAAPAQGAFNDTPIIVQPGETLDVVWNRFVTKREAEQAEYRKRKNAERDAGLKQVAATLVKGVLDLCAEGDRAGAERVIFLALGGGQP